MEDMLHFVECFSQYIFQGVLSATLQEMWGLLRKAVLHYCRIGDPAVQFTPAACKAAKDALWQYACKMEQLGFPNQMFTCNLHQAICRLPEQEAARGMVGCDAEWWVERLMQFFKATVDGKVVKDVEKTFANRVLDRDALMAMRAQRPDLKVFDELVPAYRSLPIAGPTVDDGDADGNQMLGKGQVVKRKGKMVAMTAVLDHVKKYKPAGWDEAAVQQAFADGRVLRYTRADKCGDEIISSAQYGRSSTRHNYWVEVQLQDKVRGRWVVHQQVAKVMEFLLVRHSSIAARSLRLAVCDMYKERAKEGSVVVAIGGKVGIEKENVAFSLNQINTKYVVAYAEGVDTGRMYFMKYTNMSKTR
jgi:hypothetical protein